MTLALWFVGVFFGAVILGTGYMVYDMYKARKRATWTATTDLYDPEDHSGGGGVAR